MRSFFTIAVVALSVTGLRGQTPADATVTVSGCVEQAQRTGSLADDTGTGTAASPSTAPVEANTAELVNAYLLTNATPAGSAASEGRTQPTSYTLQGREQELAKHKGHQVEVRGRIMPPRAPSGPAASKATATGIQRIAVDGVKMVSAKCPAKTP
jgi:hypothetical protein